LQYVYLFWRYYDPTTRYLEAITPDFRRFWWHVSGAQFKGMFFSFPTEYLYRRRIPHVLLLFLTEFRYITPVAVFGILGMASRKLNIFFLLAILGNSFLATNFNSSEYVAYFLPSFIIVAIYLGLALDWFVAIFRLLRVPIYAAIFLWLPAMFLVSNYKKADQHRNVITAVRTESVLNSIKRNGLIISSGYEISESFWYYLIGERWQDSNQIYLIHDFDVSKISSYIKNNTPIYLPTQRIYTPTGLKVYAVGDSHLPQLRQSGFAVNALEKNFYRISLAEANSSSMKK